MKTIDPVDLNVCRQMMREGSRSFSLAATLLPAAVAAPVTVLYAFCRSADDAIDLSGGDPGELAVLQQRLDGIFAGQPQPLAEDQGLAAVVQAYRLPRHPLEALLEGFAWDAQQRRYQSLADLEAYGARVAGSVGIMMALLMGEHRAEPLARALDLGVAMQLTNICRDVGEDAAMGRVYLPLDLLQEAGVDVAGFLRQPKHSPELAGVVSAVLERADVLYARAQQGINQLPRSVRYSIRTAALLYQEIGRTIEQHHLNSVDSRAVVPTWRQMALVARGVWPIAKNQLLLGAPVLQSCAFLHAAALSASPQQRSEGRIAETIELFIRLGERSRQLQAERLQLRL